MSILARLKTLLSFKKTSGEPALFAIVLLLEKPLLVTEEELKSAVVRVWGRELREDAKESVVLQSGNDGGQVGFIRYGQVIMMVNIFSRPYISARDLPELLKETKEMRTQKALREHTSWFSLDLFNPKNPSRTDKQFFYIKACTLAAEFAQSNCLGIIVPETNELRPYDDQVINALLSKNPLAALREWDRVPLLDEHDSLMQEAMNEARRRWPEFERAFQIRHSDQRFAVKAGFRDDENSDGEWMWVEVLALPAGVVEGKLLNDPVHLRSIRKGDTVRVPTATLGDWIYNDGNKSQGGFTEAVLGKLDP